ncbi:MAG: rhamnulokinase [Spirochaetales bacterium]|nr:rhamnulokinase [Spirochaetales bacterium]
MASKKYLVFDLGASNGRAIVAEFDGRRFTMEVTHRFDNRPVYASGTLYWDILRLFSEIKEGLRKSHRQYRDLVSMGVDTWGCDFGFIDARGKLLNNPVNYRDRRRYNLLDELYQAIPRRELFDLSAGSTIEIMGIYQLFVFRRDDAVEVRCGHRFLMIPDLFNFLLTGRACNEYSDATMSLLCDQVRCGWHHGILGRIGVPAELFGEIVFPGTTIGKIQKELREEIEVPGLSVVAPASHDTASAVAGIPVVARHDRWAFISMGTWCISGAETAAPIVTDATFESGYGNNAVVEGRNMLVKYITGLWIIQQCRQRWQKESNQELTWDEIVRNAESTPSCRSFIDVDDPLFAAPSTDMPQLIRDYCGKTGQTAPGSIGEVARAVYESLALKFRHNLETLQQVTGTPLELLHLVGGGTQNALLCQWTSDALGIPVVAGPTETTSVGNLLMQLKASGEISSIDDGRRLSLASSRVSHYSPTRTEWWDEAYASYLRVCALRDPLSNKRS